MTESVAVALITGVLAVLGSYLGNVTVSRKKAREEAIKEAERDTRQADRLDVIERKLDIHNGYAEKLGGIEKSMAMMQKDIEYLKERIKYGESK